MAPLSCDLASASTFGLRSPTRRSDSNTSPWVLLVVAVLLIAFGFYALLHYWLGRRLIGPIFSESPRRRAAWVVLALLMLSGMAAMVVGRVLPRSPGVIALQWVGLIAMGWMTVTIGLVVVRDLLWALYAGIERVAAGRQSYEDPEAEAARASRRAFLRTSSSLAVVGASAVLSADGVRRAREIAALKYVDIPIATLDPALDGLTILQLSDVHVGDMVRREYVQQVVDRCATVDADLIVITGDLVDGPVEDLRDELAPIAKLSAPLGTFFVTGNHEYYSRPLEWIEHLRTLGVHVLLDEHVVLEHAGAKIVLGGITDYNAPDVIPEHLADPRAAFEGAPEGPLRILLAHQPRSYPQAEGLGVHLQLSGHTHGGQIWPFGLLVPLQQHFIAGLHRVFDSTWLYISRGTGYWGPPMRVGSASEITVLTLRRRG